MVCGRVNNLLSAYLDRELTGIEMMSLQRHVAVCAGCRTEMEALAQVRRLLGSMPAVEPRVGSQARAFARLTVGPQVRRRQTALPSWSCFFSTRAWVWASAACLALFLVVALTGLRRPQHADTVVAMIRPEIEAAELPADPGVPVRDSWLRVRSGTPVSWGGDDRSPYQLVGMKQGW
jgi:anti-sigma factor RsiW